MEAVFATENVTSPGAQTHNMQIWKPNALATDQFLKKKQQKKQTIISISLLNICLVCTIFYPLYQSSNLLQFAQIDTFLW